MKEGEDWRSKVRRRWSKVTLYNKETEGVRNRLRQSDKDTGGRLKVRIIKNDKKVCLTFLAVIYQCSGTESQIAAEPETDPGAEVKPSGKFLSSTP